MINILEQGGIQDFTQGEGQIRAPGKIPHPQGEPRGRDRQYPPIYALVLCRINVNGVVRPHSCLHGWNTCNKWLGLIVAGMDGISVRGGWVACMDGIPVSGGFVSYLLVWMVYL